MSAELQRLTTIFSKRPEAGRVKTRLCPPLAPGEAAELAAAMLDDAVERHLAAAGYRTELAVAPSDSVEWFRERYAGRIPVSPQVGEGLGERLAHWFEARCAPGRSVVVVGSDCPAMDPATVLDAHRSLAAGVDLVLAPDGGGGYSAVGLARPQRALFTQVAMSTGTMLDETLALARARGLSVRLLAEQRDVDRPEDLARLRRELRSLTLDGTTAGRAPGAFPAHTHEWLRRHAETT